MISAGSCGHACLWNFGSHQIIKCPTGLEASGVLKKFKFEANRFFNAGNGDAHDRGSADERCNACRCFGNDDSTESHDGWCRAPIVSRQGWPRLRDIAESRMADERFRASAA